MTGRREESDDRLSVRRARSLVARGAGCCLLAAILSSCHPLPGPRTFSSVDYVRRAYAQRVGDEVASSMVVPFELSDEIRADVAAHLNPAVSERRRVEQVVDYIFGYLDLQYSLDPTRTAAETFKARSGNCLSFVNLFVGVARQLRLNPFYVEVEDYQRWKVSHGSVVSHGHIVAGVRIDGKLETYDFLPYKAKSYRDFQPIDDIKATAHYYNNLGAEALLSGDLDRAQELIEVATQLAPEFTKAINNFGVVTLRRRGAEDALAVYQRGLEIDPNDVALLTNQARALQDLGRKDEANETLARLEELNAANPFFYVYRGELALADGDLDGALALMKKAYQRDSDLPEVHLGLVKVYLALGDRQKALHHLERALKLDATNEEARKYAAMLTTTASGGR